MAALLHLPSTARLRLRLACDIEQVRPVALEARNFFATKGLTESELMACELALVEACNNAVLYVIPSRRFDSIEIDLFCDASSIEMRIHDHTAGFELPRVVQLVEPEDEHGRGLFLIHSLMDSVSYSGGIGENTLALRKNRSLLKDQNVSVKVFQEVQTKLAESEQIIEGMAEELSSCYESLSAIFRSGAELGKTRDLQEFSQSLCETLLKINSADWFLLRIVPKNEKTLLTFSASSPSAKVSPISLTESAIAVSAELKAWSYRKDIWFGSQNPLHKNDPLHAMAPSIIGLVHPIYFADALIGTLTLGKTQNDTPFTVSNVNVVHTVADFLGMQVVNARFYDEQLHHRLVTRELEIAREIQRALLPKSLPELRGFGLAGHCQSARHVGGDFYDVVQINDYSALLIVADVMGKGVPAAMFAAILRSLLRGAPELRKEPAALLTRVNHLLFEDLSEVEMFITAQLAFVDVQSREIVVASAGHCPALLFCENNTEPKLISPEGMPLGILPDTLFSEVKETLSKNCRVIFYTDGVTECRNGADQFFGHQRLVDWNREAAAAYLRTAAALKQSLASELSRFQQSEAPNDDQTFLILAEENLDSTL